MKSVFWTLGVVAVAAVVASHAFRGPGEASAASGLRVGDAVPEFSATDENGTVHALSQHKDKLVVLEWTNPDCPYVARHYRSDTMEKLAREYGDKGVVWMAVNSTRGNTPDDTKEWKAEQGFEYVTLQDTSGDLGRMFGARTTPHMFVIDDKQTLRYAGAIDDKPRGPTDKATNYVSTGLTSLLAGNDVDPSTTRAYGCSVKY